MLLSSFIKKKNFLYPINMGGKGFIFSLHLSSNFLPHKNKASKEGGGGGEGGIMNNTA